MSVISPGMNDMNCNTTTQKNYTTILIIDSNGNNNNSNDINIDNRFI